MDQAQISPSDWHSTLRGARKREGITQRQLASRVGLPQAHISRIETGQVDPRLSNAVRIARAVGFDPMLIPRRALPAVLAVLRDYKGGAGRRRPSAIELLVGDGDGDNE